MPGFEAWGALHAGRLVAALLACSLNRTVCILYQQSLTEHLRFGVNNALTFVYTQEALRRPGIQGIFYGLHSLDAPASVDEYKFRMGYTARAVRQRVVFNPLFKPFIGPRSHRLLKSFRRTFPGSYLAAKLEGMVRFYLLGKASLAEQDWPEAILDQKTTLLAALSPTIS